MRNDSAISVYAEKKATATERAERTMATIEAKGMTDIEYTTEILTIGNATVTVRRPILTEQERKRREADIISALINYNEKRGNTNG